MLLPVMRRRPPMYPSRVGELLDRCMFSDFLDDFGRRASHSLKRDLFGDNSNPADVYEKDGAFVIHIDAPGIEAKDVVIEATSSSATVSWHSYVEKSGEDGSADGKNAEKTEETAIAPKEEDASRSYIFRERTFRSFERNFPFPKKVDANRTSATYENGVLTVTVPIAEKDDSVIVKVSQSAGTAEKNGG